MFRVILAAALCVFPAFAVAASYDVGTVGQYRGGDDVDLTVAYAIPGELMMGAGKIYLTLSLIPPPGVPPVADYGRSDYTEIEPNPEADSSDDVSGRAMLGSLGVSGRMWWIEGAAPTSPAARSAPGPPAKDSTIFYSRLQATSAYHKPLVST